MTTIASRDLRNHTADVLRQVAEGAEVTVTVHGEPAALITRPRRQRSHGMARADFIEFLDRQSADAHLADDLAWISEGTTDDLRPVT